MKQPARDLNMHVAEYTADMHTFNVVPEAVQHDTEHDKAGTLLVLEMRFAFAS